MPICLWARKNTTLDWAKKPCQESSFPVHHRQQAYRLPTLLVPLFPSLFPLRLAKIKNVEGAEQTSILSGNIIHTNLPHSVVQQIKLLTFKTRNFSLCARNDQKIVIYGYITAVNWSID